MYWSRGASHFLQHALLAMQSVILARPFLSVRLSVCPSVTFRYCVQPNEDMIVWFSASGRTILLVNRKSHMGFRLVPKSVTLKDLERRNGHVVCVTTPISVDFGAYYVKVVEDTRTHSPSEMYNNDIR